MASSVPAQRAALGVDAGGYGVELAGVHGGELRRRADAAAAHLDGVAVDSAPLESEGLLVEGATPPGQPPLAGDGGDGGSSEDLGVVAGAVLPADARVVADAMASLLGARADGCGCGGWRGAPRACARLAPWLGPAFVARCVRAFAWSVCFARESSSRASRARGRASSAYVDPGNFATNVAAGAGYGCGGRMRGAGRGAGLCVFECTGTSSCG